MLKNYIVMALRNIRKQKGYSIINLSGLAIGMACCILIMLFVFDELSYDKYHVNADRIYRIVTDGEIGGATRHFALAPLASGLTFNDEIPEVESFTSLINVGNILPNLRIQYGDKSFEENSVYLADTTFFDMFTYEFVTGDPATVLDGPGKAVLTETTAKRIFGDEDPIGKSFTMTFLGDVEVGAIIKDVPRNSHFHFDFMLSVNKLPAQQRAGMYQWLNIQGYSYIMLNDGADPLEVSAKFPEIFESKTGTVARQYGISMDFTLQKVTDIHLHSQLEGEAEPTGDITYVYIFSAIAIFILCIACINFMNLSTARSAKRAREVGMRKVFGAYKKNLVVQFLSESVIISLMGLILAVGIAWLAVPAFNGLTEKELSSGFLANGQIWLGLLIMVIFTGLVAGSYPAVFLSSFRPIVILRGAISKGAKSSNLRVVLVVFQFSISVILIASTLIVLEQLSFMKNENLGWNKDQLLVVRIQDNATNTKQNTIRNELIQNPNILQATFSNSVPGNLTNVQVILPEGNQPDETHMMEVIRVDYDFVETYGFELKDGRIFSQDFGADSAQTVLVNEAAIEKFAFDRDALGKKISIMQGPNNNPSRQIVGILKDFHYRSLKQVIQPTLIVIGRNAGFLSLRVSSDNTAETVAFVEDKWKEFEPGREFEYSFMDEDFDGQYRSEDTLSKIFTYFAVLAIFVACLGLFGLASFIAEQKTKEIGIKKVLGASAKTVVVQLTKDFTKWVVLSNLFGWPAAYYLMNTWLTNFPYKIEPAIYSFFLAGILSFLIALITVSYQSLKAASISPADALRYE